MPVIASNRRQSCSISRSSTLATASERKWRDEEADAGH
jgi:hypothetical protein